MAIEQTLFSDLPVPPGEYLEEIIEDLGMTKDELAKRMNRPAPKLSAIFKGDKAITPDTALQLEKVVGVPAHIWTGMESDYRLALARELQEKEQERLKSETSFITRFRYAELVKMGLLEKKTRAVDKVLELQKFFAVTSLKTVSGLKRYQPAFRTSRKAQKGKTPEAVAAWLRMGELMARKLGCAPFSKKKMEGAISVIRSMTHKDPDKIPDNLHQELAHAGVALVICPHLPGTGLHGATFWLAKDKAVVMMTLRYKWADIFWFSLFHELGHILLHGRQAVVLEGFDKDPDLKKQEDEADRFAADILIPPKAYNSFITNKHFYQDDIRQFSSNVGIDTGIVVGRMQNDGIIDPSWHNGMRTRFQLNDPRYS
jgi:HTH-type transcriptional regulator / antitoxin HigA